MARNRIIYQSEALYVSETGASGPDDIFQITRVQSANYSFDVSRQDINQFGQLAAIDRIIVESPTVSLDFSYYCETGANENKLGLTVGRFQTTDANMLPKFLGSGVSCISGILQGSDTGDLEADDGNSVHRAAEKRRDISNYYVSTVSEGNDAVGNTGIAKGIIGIGNGFMTSYSANGSVGDFVTADVSVEGLNMVFDGDNDNLITNPAVSEADGTFATEDDVTIPGVIAGTGDAISGTSGNLFSSSADADIPTVLRHGDIVLSGSAANMTLGHTISGATNDAAFGHHAQNYSFSFDLSRTDLEKLGSRFAYTKEMDFPLSASVDVSYILGDLDANATEDGDQSIATQFTTAGADASFNFAVLNFGVGSSLGAAESPAGTKADGLGFAIKGAKTDSQGYSSSIGDAKTMDISASAQIGGPEDTANGILIAHLTDIANVDPFHVI
tara:strand:- start:114 stop:1445 length:1332 start_codon:yes stop_codon:yes gene_type:complete